MPSVNEFILSKGNVPFASMGNQLGLVCKYRDKAIVEIVNIETVDAVAFPNWQVFEHPHDLFFGKLPEIVSKLLI